MRIVIVSVVLLLLSLETAMAAQTFNLAADYASSGNNENSTWSFRYKQGNVGQNENPFDRNGNYTLLPDFKTTNVVNLSWVLPMWVWDADGNDLPWVVWNCTDNTQTSSNISLGSEKFAMHPGFGHFVVVSWKSPADGQVTIDYEFADIQPGGPTFNSIAWYVELNEWQSTIDSGALETGQSSGPRQSIVSVSEGDRINFVVDENGTANSDCTFLRVTICLDDGSPDTCVTLPVPGCITCELTASSTACESNDVLVEFESTITQGGTFTARNCSAPGGDLDANCSVDPDSLTFGLPTDPVQFWDLDFTGDFTGTVLVTVTYDDSNFLPFFSEQNLTLFHLVDDVWSPLEIVSLDTDTNTLTVRTSSFSLFMLSAEGPIIPAWSWWGPIVLMISLAAYLGLRRREGLAAA